MGARLAPGLALLAALAVGPSPAALAGDSTGAAAPRAPTATADEIARLDAELRRLRTELERARARLAELRPDRGAGAADPDERWYEAKFREAAQRLARGDPLGAARILDAILTIEPHCPIRDRIQALKVRAKELHLRASTLEARLVPKRVLAEPGRPLELTLELENVSGAPLDLALPGSGTGEIFGLIEVERYDAAASGARARTRETQRVSARVKGRLEPGEALRVPIALDPGRPLPRDGFRRVTVSGSVRSHVLAKGAERFDRFLPVFPVEVHVLDRSRHALAADPLPALAGALAALSGPADERSAAAAAERAFFAALLVPAAEREPAIALLAGRLDRDGDPAGPLALRVLAALADPPFERDRAEWLEWVRRR